MEEVSNGYRDVHRVVGREWGNWTLDWNVVSCAEAWSVGQWLHFIYEPDTATPVYFKDASY